MPITLPQFVAALEIGLALVGVALLWRIALRPKMRGLHATQHLPPWNVPLRDFFVFIFCVVTGSFAGVLISMQVVKLLPLRGDEVTVFNGSAAQLGMLVGLLIYRLQAPKPAGPPPPLGTGIIVSGAVTFLVALPVLIATAKAWELFLEVCGLPTEKQ